MSRFDNKQAAALKYEDNSSAPVVVAAGSGYIADKIVEVAQNNSVPVYHDNSLATLLAQLQVGTEIPPELYQAIVEIYVYFLNYAPKTNILDEQISSKSEEIEEKVKENLIDIDIKDSLSAEEEVKNIIKSKIESQGRFLDISIGE